MARYDVVVIGAGAAGLAAARALSGRGLSVAIMEARDRIGGRVHTVRPSGSSLPVELGAEFVHGRPRETLAIAQAAGLTLVEQEGVSWVSTGGRLQAEDEMDEMDEEDVTTDGESSADNDEEDRDDAGDEDAHDDDAPMEAILRAAGTWQGEDVSFQHMLASRFAGDHWAAARRQASGYVEGFDAAFPERVSVRWLALAEAAAASIEGERQFRPLEGYDRFFAWLRDGLQPEQTVLRLRTVAREVRWKRGRVEVVARSPLGADLEPVEARAAIVTLPLGVLAAPPDEQGAVRFTPEPPGKRESMALLEMGHVVKVVLRFREPFWDMPRGYAMPAGMREAMPRLSFLFSDDTVLPTWWTSYPLLSPTLTGWVGGPRAAALVRNEDADVVAAALAALARVLSMERSELEVLLTGWHFANWSADPFARGAYSYVRVGGIEAPRRLGEPVADTLFFAGEATDMAGHTGTVHGALASGLRAAGEVAAALGRAGA